MLADWKCWSSRVTVIAVGRCKGGLDEEDNGVRQSSAYPPALMHVRLNGDDHGGSVQSGIINDA